MLGLALPLEPKVRLGMRVTSVLSAWTRVLRGYAPILSIEITRECPLSCPGCYAYGDSHLGGNLRLRELSDLRGDALVEGIVTLAKRHAAGPSSDRGLPFS